jgi:hypothetical protein
MFYTEIYNCRFLFYIYVFDSVRLWLDISNDIGPLFLGPESTRILEINIHLFISSIRVDPGPRNRGPTSLLALKNMCKHGEIKVYRSSACGPGKLRSIGQVPVVSLDLFKQDYLFITLGPGILRLSSSLTDAG